MKTQRLRIRASQEDLDLLKSVALTLGLDASSAIWSVLREKERELAVQAALIAQSTQSATAPGGKKRRPRAA